MTRAESRDAVQSGGKEPEAESRELQAGSPEWDSLGAAELATRCAVEQVHLFRITDSTLDVAHALAEQGAAAGTVVVADAQRAGRGSHGRVWSSEAGMGVWCSVIERGVDVAAFDLLSLRVGLGVAERLDALAGGTVGLKWPNDIFLGGAKLGGILVEARWSGSTLGWVAIGIGINVMRPMTHAVAAGMPRGTARVDVLVAAVSGARAAARCQGRLSADELARYRARDVVVGKRVVEPVAGMVTGLSSMGELVVETREGTKRLRTGTIRMAEGV